jgi:hypothetical protein
MIVALRKGFVLGLTIAACSGARAPLLDSDEDDLRGIEGANCAGAAPEMTAPDGLVYPFQSVVAYYYQVLAAYWTKVDAGDVLQTWLPAEIQATSEAFYAWQAKSVQIYQDRDLLGFSHRYYHGMFGFAHPGSGPGTGSGAGSSGSGAGSAGSGAGSAGSGAGSGGSGAGSAGSGAGSGGSGTGSAEACSDALTPDLRLAGMLAHVALSQAGVCGQNDDGTTKFWQVKRISLLQIGDVVDANALIDAGLAEDVAGVPSDRCILPAVGWPGPGPGPGAPLPVPCQIAFRADAVTEGVVLPVPSSAVVAEVALGHRAFTAAGTIAMPNSLDDVRKILRDGELRAMFAIGVPTFMPAPWAGPTQVQLVGHRVGPAQSPSSVLLPDERAWVDGVAGVYDASCCKLVCQVSTSSAARATAKATKPGDPVCTQACVPEGVCETRQVNQGLVVMVSSVTTKDCFGSCPAPASDAPATAPACAP